MLKVTHLVTLGIKPESPQVKLCSKAYLFVHTLQWLMILNHRHQESQLTVRMSTQLGEGSIGIVIPDLSLPGCQTWALRQIISTLEESAFSSVKWGDNCFPDHLPIELWYCTRYKISVRAPWNIQSATPVTGMKHLYIILLKVLLKANGRPEMGSLSQKSKKGLG